MLSMNTYAVLQLISTLAVGLDLVGSSAAQSTSSSGSAIISTVRQQTINGFGASGAWWPQDLYNFTQSVQANVSTLLFSPASAGGLGLQSYRYNIGAGGEGVNITARATPSFFVSPGVYNFSADPAGSYFLRAASQAKVPQLTAFANSAPPPWTTNGLAEGGQLRNDSLAAYSGYLKDVVGYWRGQGVNISYLSPINEPDQAFNSAQEGMAVPVTLRAPLASALYQALQMNSSTASVGIMMDENNNLIFAQAEYPSWLPQAKTYLSTIAHHAYEFPTNTSANTYFALARNLAPSLQTWFTETCCFATQPNYPDQPTTYSQGYDPTILSGLTMAGIIYQSFVVTGDSHFDWWTALSPAIGCSPGSNQTCNPALPNTQGYNDGLIYYDPSYATTKNYQLYFTKRYHILRHFTTFVPIGSIMHNVTNLPSSVKGMAFELPSSSGSNAWSFLVWNPSSQDVNVTLSIAGNLQLSSVSSTRTSSSIDFGNVTAPSLTNGNSGLQGVLGAGTFETWTFTSATMPTTGGALGFGLKDSLTAVGMAALVWTLLTVKQTSAVGEPDQGRAYIPSAG